MGVGGGVGGQKFVVRRLQAVGGHVAVTTNPGRMVTQPAADFWVGSFESWTVNCHRLHRRHVRPTRVRSADQKDCGKLHCHSATTCPRGKCTPHCSEPSLPLTQNPTCVFLSVWLLAWLTD